MIEPNYRHKKAVDGTTLNTIYNEDCITTMSRMHDGFVDLTVTSPPYDNLRSYTGDIEWNISVWEHVIEELYRVTKDGGIVVWVVGDATIKGSETGTSFKQALYAIECGFNLHDTMIFKKRNPVPQFKTKRYTNTFEYMFVFSKGQPKQCNYLTTQCKTAGNKINRNSKGAFSLNSADKPREEITITKENKILNNVWDYSVGTKKDTGHPAVFPEQLVNDHILSWSNEYEVIYDPFMGSGTTAKMALVNNRYYIGSEISKEYCDIIDERIRTIETV